MSVDPHDLRREADTFARYLIGERIADETVVDHYVRAHGRLTLVPRRGIDATLVGAARLHPLITRLADAYARRLAPASSLRRKLVVLMAMLESVHPSARAFDAPAVSAVGVVLRLMLIGAGAAAATILALLVFGPLHALSALSGRNA